MTIHQFTGIDSFDQPTQVTFPFPGTVSFTLIGGGGAGGGKDVHPGQNGANGERIDGQFRVDTNTNVVFHIGSGGRPGASDSNSFGGGDYGRGLIHGGSGGNPGGIGSSGGGGGGGAATFIMFKSEFDKLITANTNFSFLGIAGGGGGGGGAGVANGIDPGTTSALSTTIYGDNGQSNTQDGGGGGGGGGGLVGGAGGGANPLGYDTTGLRGRNGLSGISSGASSSGRIFDNSTTSISGTGGGGSRTITTTTTTSVIDLPVLSCDGTRGTSGAYYAAYLLDFGNNTGICGASYDFYSALDVMEIVHNGVTYTTGATTFTGSLTFNRAPGTSRYAILYMNRNFSGSYWEFNLICPSGPSDSRTNYPIPAEALRTVQSTVTSVLPSERGKPGYVGILYTPDDPNISNVHIKVNGQMKRVPKISYRANNSWVDVKDAYIRVNGQWVNIYTYVDPNTLVPTFTKLNVPETIPFDSVPPYPYPIISCTGTTSASGSHYSAFILDFGSRFGTAGASYNFYGATDEMEIVHNGITYTTGPTRRLGSLTFNRAPGTSRYAVLYMNRNIGGSAWEFNIICPT